MRFLTTVVAVSAVSIVVAGCSSSRPVELPKETKSLAQTRTQQSLQSQSPEQKGNVELDKEIGRFVGNINSVGNTNGNLNGDGIVAKEGNRVYFSDGKGIFVANFAYLAKRKQLDSATDKYSPITGINVINNVVYYIKNGDVWRINANGSGKKQLTKDAGTARIMAWQDKIVYIEFYNNEAQNYKCNRLCIINNDGTGKRILSGEVGNVESFVIDNNILYYSVDGYDEPKQTLMAYSLNKNDSTSYDKGVMAGHKTIKETAFNYFLVEGTRVIYTTVKSINFADLSGKDRFSYAKGGGSLNHADGSLFYLDDQVGINQAFVTVIPEDGSNHYQSFASLQGAQKFGVVEDKIFALVDKETDFNYELKIETVLPWSVSMQDED